MTKIINEIQAIENKRCNLIDLHLDDKIGRSTYERKYAELESFLNELLDERAKLEESAKNEVDVEKRITHFRQVHRSNAVLPTFDRSVLESVVDKNLVRENCDDGSTKRLYIKQALRAAFKLR